MPSITSRLASRHLYFLLFAVSGFSGLIYESIWSHYLKLFLGHAAYAQTLVLVIFMGGMAIGAWLAGRYSGRIGNLLLAYALIEAVIGLLAVAFHPLFTTITGLAYDSVIPNLPTPGLAHGFKWTLAGLLILPQSILLGATFPMMSAGILRRFPAAPAGHTLAILYFSNSLGASLGVLFSGFVLIELVGLPGTILTAGLINLLLALAVWLLCREDAPLLAVSPPATPSQAAPRPSLLFPAMLLAAGITGAASFLYEIGWLRMLSLVLGSSTHAFELMLSAFILGLALGGYWIRGRIDRYANPIKVLGIVQLLMGTLALTTLLSYGQWFEFMSFIMQALQKSEQGYVLFNLFSHAIALLVMLPATFCAGMTLPLMTYYLFQRGYGERAIGSVYAANTLGSIFGVAAGVQWIMPEFGVKQVITVGSGLDLLLGLALLWAARPALAAGWRWAAALFAALALLPTALWWKLDSVAMSSGVYRHGQVPHNREILYHRDGKTATAALYRTPDGKTAISTNGKPDAAIGPPGKPGTDELTMTLLGAMPWAIQQNLRQAAVIGLGSGMTSHTLLSIPALERVDTIEIEPAMVEAARGFGARVEKVFNDPRGRIHLEDAKTYFTNHHRVYDLIVSEPSNPWVSGVAGLFSEEFYRMLRGHLSDDGLLVQWVHIYELNMPLLATIFAAINASFEDYAVYFPVEGDIVIIARKHGAVGPPGAAVFDPPELRKELNYLGIDGVDDLRLRYLGSRATLEPLFQSYGVPAHSDYFPLLDLGAARARFLNQTAAELLESRRIALPLLDMLENRAAAPLQLSDRPMIQAGLAARQAQALAAYFQQRRTQPNPPLPALEPAILQALNGVIACPPQAANWNPAQQVYTLAALQDLALRLLPYLSPAELQPVWEDLLQSPCAMPDAIRAWLELYQAASRRDAAALLAQAQKLLPSGAIPPSADHDYLLAAALLALLSQGQTDAALDMLRRYPYTQATPQSRLLAGIAVQRARQRQSRPQP
jgi:spermidine synthase/MFS family permease